MGATKHWHPILAKAVIDACRAIFEQGELADRVVHHTLRADKRRGSRDRKWLAYYIYEGVRWYRLWAALSGKQPKSEQDWWEWLGSGALWSGDTLPKWREFKQINLETIQQRYQTIQNEVAITQSIPDWLHAVGLQELGENWDSFLVASNQPAPVILRVNRIKTDRKTLQTALEKQNIATQLHPILKDALLLEKRTSLQNNPLFKNGHFEIQDASSQQVVTNFKLKKGMKIMDACAGGGGKTLHLASLLHDDAQIVALDKRPQSLEQLRKRAKRAGVHCIKTKTVHNLDIVQEYKNWADALLIDAPCSGLGTLRRNPDAKWKLQSDFLAYIRKTQAQILADYSKMCKKGGQMIYATCSVLPSENEQQIEKFLSSPNGKDFKLVKQQSILPNIDDGDGFYIALLEKSTN